MTQLTIDNLKTKYAPLITKYDKHRTLLSFADTGVLPENLKLSEKPVWLAGGQPFESMFPIQKIEYQLRHCPGSIDDFEVSSEDFTTCEIPLYSTEQVAGIKKVGISTALQYSNPNGFPELLSLTKQIISRMNKPKYDEWATIVTNGSSDSLWKICSLLMDEDSTMLIEEFTFPSILNHLHFSCGREVPVKLNITSDPDTQGIDTDYLADLLDNWFEKFPKETQKPKCLYTIATGHNPTGITQSSEKRQKIYDICCKHNVIIIEDDPYGYLKFPKFDSENPMNNPYFKNEYSVDDFCNKILSPSYLNIDVEGRVLRCETFSKVGSPGLRLGFIAGNRYLIEKLNFISAVTTRASSGASQALVVNMLLDMGKKYREQPGMETAPLIDGWIEWCMKIAGQYTHRRNTMFKYIYQQPCFKEKKIELIEPSCGMFVSILINLKPEWASNVKRVMDYLYCCLMEEGCYAVLGYRMTIDKEMSMERANFMRFTFAKANNPKDFETGLAFFNTAVERLFVEYGCNEKFHLSENGL